MLGLRFMVQFFNKIIFALFLFQSVENTGAITPPPVDVVFIMDESGSLGAIQSRTFNRATQVFDAFESVTGGNFSVGVAGFGSSAVVPRKVGTLSNNRFQFWEALASLQLSGGTEPGFEAIARVATNSLQATRTISGLLLQGNDANAEAFPGLNGFCAIIVTDEPSNGDQGQFTVADVVQSLKDANNSILFATVPQPQLATTGETYGAIAAATGGLAINMFDYGTNDTFAQEIIDQMISACVAGVNTEAECEPNGPYNVSDIQLPASIDLQGSPNCSDGTEPTNVFWSSDNLSILLENNSSDLRGPTTAVIFDEGVFEVCQTVECNYNLFGVSVPSTCCTALTVKETTSLDSNSDDNVLVNGTAAFESQYLIALQAFAQDLGAGSGRIIGNDEGDDDDESGKSGKGGKDGKSGNGRRRRSNRGLVPLSRASKCALRATENDVRRRYRHLENNKRNRPIVSYGDRDATFGLPISRNGRIAGLSVVLEEPLASGTLSFFVQINQMTRPEWETLVFNSTEDFGVTSKAVNILADLVVFSGDVLEIGVGHLVDEITNESLVEPQMNKASIVILVEQK